MNVQERERTFMLHLIRPPLSPLLPPPLSLLLPPPPLSLLLPPPRLPPLIENKDFKEVVKAISQLDEVRCQFR